MATPNNPLVGDEDEDEDGSPPYALPNMARIQKHFEATVLQAAPNLQNQH